MCLDTVEQLRASSSDPHTQRGVLQALDHVLYMTPAAHPSVYDRLCSLVMPVGNPEAQGVTDEIVDLVFRHSDRFSFSDETSELKSTVVDTRAVLLTPLLSRHSDTEPMC